MIVYKYLRPERIDVLKNSSIRFTQPDSLNDPFEALWVFNEDLRNETIREAELQHKLQYGRSMTDNEHIEFEERLSIIMPKLFSEVIGFLSLSKKKNISLMWSHYADEHRGFVVGFDSKLFQSNSKFTPLNKVNYSRIRPTYFNPENREVGCEQLKTLLLTKSKNWRYEEEFRAIVRLEHADNIPPKKDDKGYEICLFNFPPKSIKEVIFGLRLSLEKRAEVRDLIKVKYPQAQLFEAKVSKSSFNLDIIPLQPNKL